MTDHECVFVEEQEPSGRLVLPPCIICGITAMDALAEVKRECGASKSDMGQAYALKCDDLRRETERTTQLSAAVSVLTKERDAARAACDEWEARCDARDQAAMNNAASAMVTSAGWQCPACDSPGHVHQDGCFVKELADEAQRLRIANRRLSQINGNCRIALDLHKERIRVLQEALCECPHRDFFQADLHDFMCPVHTLAAEAVKERCAQCLDSGDPCGACECHARSWQLDGYALCRASRGHSGSHFWEVQ